MTVETACWRSSGDALPLLMMTGQKGKKEMLDGNVIAKLLEAAQVVAEATKDVPEELFVSLIATMVDEFAIRRKIDNDTVIGWYKSIIELKPQVDAQMAGEAAE